jgi:hypothetical protein
VNRIEAESEVMEITASGMGLVGITTIPDPETGFIPALNTPLRAGLISAGIRTATRTVTDADFVTLAPEDEDKVIAVAKLNILDRILLLWNRTDHTDNGSSWSYLGLYKQLSLRADALRKQIESDYGTVTAAAGAEEIGMGVLSLNVLEDPDETDC